MLYMRGYVLIDPSTDRRRIIVSILGHGIQRKTKKISNEDMDPWWYEYPYLYSSQRHHSPPSIKIFFGHQRHDKAWVSHWACALDGGVVFGGTLRAYVENKGILEINAKRAYEMDEEKRPSSSSVAV